jgi:hypothetical protein
MDYSGPVGFAVLWLLYRASRALVNLIWLAIIVLVVIWLIGLVRGRSATSGRPRAQRGKPSGPLGC